MRKVFVAWVVLVLGCSSGDSSSPRWTLQELETRISGLDQQAVENAVGPPNGTIPDGSGREAWWVYRNALTTNTGPRHARVFFHPLGYVSEVAAVTDQDLWDCHRATWRGRVLTVGSPGPRP